MKIKRITSTGSIVLAVVTFLATYEATNAKPRGQGNTLGEIAARLGVPFAGYWHGWTPKGDVDGKVGYPLSITGPRMVRDDPNYPNWTADIVIESGQLPPGLIMRESGANTGDISGVPTERGTWIVIFKIANLTSNGHRFTMQGAPDVLVENQGWKNQDDCVEDGQGYCSLTTIRFHITGSGKVHTGSETPQDQE